MAYKVSTGIDHVSYRGRLDERFTACLSGETLVRKDGRPRLFQTAKAARDAAYKEAEDRGYNN